MIEIKLWTPCLDCRHAAIKVESVRTALDDPCSRRLTIVECAHAPVCARIARAKPLLGDDAS